MKRLIFFIAFVFCFLAAKAQLPITQSIGSPTTLVQVPANGGLRAGLINRTFVDTNAANNTYLAYYQGCQIFTTTDSMFWVRDVGATRWRQLYIVSTPSGGGGSPVDTVIWRVSGTGQTVVNSLSGGGIGTANIVPLWLITSGAIRIQIPAAGITRQTAARYKTMLYDTIDHNLGYGDGGSGSTPTWQQTLTAGSTLTGNNTIDGGGFNLKIDNSSYTNWAVSPTQVYSSVKAGTNIYTEFVQDEVSFIISTQDTNGGAVHHGDIYVESDYTLGASAFLQATDYSTYFVKSYVDATGIHLKAASSYPATNKGIDIALTGEVSFDTVNNDDTETKLLTWNSSSKNIEYKNTSSLTVPISSLTAATGGNTINNGNNSQFWQWNSYTGDGTSGGLVLSSSSTAVVASDPLFNVNVAGALGSGITSLAAKFSNTHTGTSSSNVAGWFESSGGTNNYAIIVPASGGNVGIGTSTPAKILHTVGTVRMASLGTASSDTTTNKPLGINSSGDIIPMTYWPGGGSSGLTIGTTTIANSVSGSVLYDSSGVLSRNDNFYWDRTNIRLGISTNSPDRSILVKKNSTGSTLDVLPTISVQNTHVSSGASDYSFSSFELAGGNGAVVGEFFADGSGYFNSGTANLYFRTKTSSPILFGVNSSEAMRISSSGYLGIGVTSPTARLHLPAGTASANTAPLKFTTGTSLTTAEAGAMEYSTPQLFFTNGGAVRQELFQGNQNFVQTQFDKTSNTTLGDVTNLSVNVAAGKAYRFEAILYTSSNSSGGVKAAISGTATATTIIYEGLTTDAGLTTQSRATSLGTAVGAVTAVTAAYIKITGTIIVNAAGTLTVQFAQNASNGSASSVLVGSTFHVIELAYFP